jgi:D-amino-acid dehydrogenase
MTRGVCLTTGAEFAARDSAPTPLQMDRTEPLAREIFPLGDGLIRSLGWEPGPVCPTGGLSLVQPQGPGCPFGHNHYGPTLGPTIGQLLAEMMTSRETLTDPKPYLLDFSCPKLPCWAQRKLGLGDW